MSQTNLDTSLWSDIEQTFENVERLRLLSHSQTELRRSGYVIEPLSTKQLESKQRCERCGARIKMARRKPITKLTLASTPEPITQPITLEPAFDDTERVQTEVKESIESKPPPRPVCSYHSGRVYKKIFSCCQQHVSKPGCKQAQKHTFPPEVTSSLAREWHYFKTPPCFDEPRATAIALDCEMGGTFTGETELLRLTAIDIFTKDILINKLVKPSVPIKDYRTRYSGVSAKMMHEAERSGDCIFGRDAARKLLWKYVGPETIVVAHGGQNDLSVLRWIHPSMVDTFILQSYEHKMEGGHSLKNLSQQMCGLSIQNGRGHDSLEDAMACREILHRWMLLISD